MVREDAAAPVLRRVSLDVDAVESGVPGRADVARAATDRWERVFWQEMKERGVFLTANQFECQFTSYAHTEEDVEETLAAYREAL